jgi:hypothetical protein
MAYNPINLGPKTMAESQAVSLPTDQVAIPVKIDQSTPGTTNKVDIGTTGTVTANAGTGTMNVSVQNASLAVTGPLTDALLRASAVPVSLLSLPSLAAGSAVIGSIANATFASTQSGTWNVGLSAGSNIIGSVKIDQSTPGTTNKVNIGTDGTVAVTGVATSANQTNGTQQTKLTNGTITADIKTLGTQVVSADNGIIVNAVMHGLTTGGGGGYVDVKVNPSGSLAVDASGSTVGLSAGTNAIGSITNTAFGISGTLPAFTSTPTFNVGTIGTIATESTLSTLNNKFTISSTRLLVDGSGVTQPVSSSASISGGVNCKTGSSPGGNFSLAVKSGPGQVYGWYFYNPNTVVAYVKIYNLETTTPTGSGVPVCVLPIPPVSGANVFGIGIPFDSNICITIATTRSGAGILGADLDYNIFYK